MLYPLEDPTHQAALDKIINEFDCQYAYINHDKDLDDDDNLKKAHTHVVLSFKNPRWSTKLAEDLGITINYIKDCEFINKALTYLIHLNEIDKFQYSIDEVHGPLRDKLVKIYKKLNQVDDDIAFNEIREYIVNTQRFIRYSEVAKFVLDNNYFGAYRRSYYVLRDMIYEHNNKYM